MWFLSPCLTFSLRPLWFPAETMDRVIALNIPAIRGNHECQLLDLTYEQMGPSDKYAAGQPRDEHREWLRSLP